MPNENETPREFRETFLRLFENRRKEAEEDWKLALEIADDIDKMRSRVFEDYGGQFVGWSLEQWMAQYAFARHRATRLKDFFQSFGENLVGGYVNDARECFWQIQQRKLFNMQCQFRAGKIKIPEIGSVYEFSFWGQHIAHCPFLSPVTEEEVDLYLAYLKSDYCNVEGLAFAHGWQSYDEYHREYDDGSNYDDDDDEGSEVMPPWYVFYDMHMGTSEMLTYPDLRGERETMYRKLAREHNGFNRRMEEAVAQTAHIPLPLPYVSGHEEQWLMHFAERYDTFENRELLRNKLNVEGEFGENFEEIKYELETAYDLVLSVAKEKWPVEWNEDWRMGLIKAAHKYRVHKIAQSLPFVFEEYQMRLELGLTTDEEPPVMPQSFHDSRAEILLGRKLMGEPEDFDF